MATQAPREPASPDPSRPATSQPRQSSLTTLKSYKDFRLVWAGNFIALGGQWIQMFSIGWLVLLLTDGNAILTGTVIAIRALPILIIGPWAGVLADRVDRRKVVMATQAVITSTSPWTQEICLVAMYQFLNTIISSPKAVIFNLTDIPILWVLFLGIILGFIGSIRAVSKYLK